MNARAYNFGAGPATLPTALLEEAQSELLNWQNLGMSVLEIGHRSSEFMALLTAAELDLRVLLAIPDHYHVLFLGGAARSHFGLIPLNVLGNGRAAYHVTGLWSALALSEAQCVGEAYRLDSAKHQILPDTQYLYFTPNETVNGVQCSLPQYDNARPLPIVADMTSCLLTEPLNISDYAFIFAGAQKNIAPAGLSLLIIRDDFLDLKPLINLPAMLDYRTHVAQRSLYATPPTFNCYMAAKMFAWLKQQGGLEVMQAQNIKKSTLLYDYIDSSDMYQCTVDKSQRSRLNVCFELIRPELSDLFVTLASQEGLLALKGHRSVGGLRASLYNAMPIEGVMALLDFMKSFAQKHC